MWHFQFQKREEKKDGRWERRVNIKKRINQSETNYHLK